MVLSGLISQETYGSKPLIHMRDLQLSYGSGVKQRIILEGLDLDVQAGEFVCVLGPSGCGKSSLLKLIAGYETATAGDARVNGEELRGPSTEIGVVFQQATLFPWLTVEKNVSFSLKMKGVPRTLRKQIARERLAQVGLIEVAGLLPHQLSGGMKQRAAIARTLAAEPKLMLMDEPFGALDSITRQSLQEQLSHLWRQTNKTIFFITHDVDEALYLGSRIIVMNGKPGRIMLDVNNPLNGKSSNAENHRELRGYNELRHRLLQSLKIS